jgi:hypothetical protein
MFKISQPINIILGIKKPVRITGFYFYQSNDYLTVTLANLRLPT